MNFVRNNKLDYNNFMFKIKQKLRKYIPSKAQIIEHRTLKIFGKLLREEHLWSFDKHTVARGVAIGAFCAWIPIPFHTVISVLLAIILRANVPFAAALVWLANPVTMPEFYFIAYKIGVALLHITPKHLLTHISITAIEKTLTQVWQPFLLGCLVCGFICAVIGYICTKLFWRKSA
jgi:uncharacterized protein (DUF2062 family)